MKETQDAGIIRIDHPEPLVAGERITITFVFEVGSAGMQEEGRLRVALPNPGWGEPLVPQFYFWDCFQKGKDRRYTDYDRVNTTVRVESRNRKAVPFLKAWPGFMKPFDQKKNWLKNYDRWWIEVTLEDDGLDPGDRIVVTYGDPEKKPYTAHVQRFPDRKLCFLAYADIDGTNRFLEAKGSPWMTSVQSGAASRMDVFLPSVILEEANPEFLVTYTDSVKVKPQPEPAIGTLLVTDPGGERTRIEVNRSISSVRLPLPPSKTRKPVLRLTVEDRENACSALSNPGLLRAEGPKLFWGDLHTQSIYHGWSEEDQIGIGCGEPEEIYDFARNTAGLDFCAITDSRSITKKDIWPLVRQAALDANQDGKFVVFQGTEIGDNTDGHRNTIFATEKPEPLVEASPIKERPLAAIPAHMAQELYHGRDDVLLIYHHTKVWNNWSRWDPAVESILEIYSAWGSCEKPGAEMWGNLAEQTGGAQEAWSKGYRLGVVANSDTHTGTPGRVLALAERDDMLMYSNGIAGVWSEELTRPEIFKSLKARRCYGTTGVKIIIEVFLLECPMGSEVQWEDPENARELRLNIYGTDRIETVDIVKNNEDVHTFRPEKDLLEDSWSDKTRAVSGDYYYLRVTQRDGHKAWTSPIWVDLAG